MSSLISVIVPVYNIEPYINQCIDSIIHQTYSNLEIILVDDGSPDNCPMICDEWTQKDNRIKVIHKENGGLSDARNAGLKLANGEYISFIDGDDCINLYFFEILLKTIQSEKSDIVQCEYIKKFNYDFSLNNMPNYITASYDTNIAFKMLLGEDSFRQVVWNKLYKRSVINLDFVYGVTNEDEFWTYRIFDNAEKITYINAPLYYYIQREGSIMGETYSLKRLDGIRARVQRHHYIEEFHPNLLRYSKIRVYLECVYAYQMSEKYLCDEELKKAKEYLLSIACEFKPSFSDFKGETLKQKIWLLMLKISFVGTCRFRSLIGYGF